MLTYQYRNLILASLLLGNTTGFMPSSIHTTTNNNNKNMIRKSTSSPSFAVLNQKITHQILSHNTFHPSKLSSPSSTKLQMASDDFNESTYTESAWSCIASLTKAADYYSTTTIDSQLLLDVMLNPSKHNAGDDALSAKKAAEKVFLKADVDVSTVKQELEMYMSKQAKIAGSMDGQKTLGRSMAKVLERARDNMSLLGVSIFLLIVFFYSKIE